MLRKTSTPWQPPQAFWVSSRPGPGGKSCAAAGRTANARLAAHRALAKGRRMRLVCRRDKGRRKPADHAGRIVIQIDRTLEIARQYRPDQDAAEASAGWRGNNRASGFAPHKLEAVRDGPGNIHLAVRHRQGAILHGVGAE